jgi:nucleoid-associated protein YgaU
MSSEETRKENQEEKEKKPAKSKLGKEAKIGVSFLLILLVVLGIVVVMKMTSGAEEKVASADADAGKAKPAGLGFHDPAHKDAKSEFPSRDRQATYVPPARNASAKPPKGFQNDASKDPWSLASDKKDAKRAGAPGSDSPFMQEPPKPYPDDRSRRHDADPFGKERRMDGELADSRHPKKTTSDLDIIVTDDEPRHPTPRKVYGRGNDELGSANDLTRIDPAPSPLPPDRTRHRFDDSKSLAAAPTAWEEPSSGFKSRSLPPPPDEGDARPKFNDRRRNTAGNINADNDLRGGFDRPSYGSLPARRNDGKYEIEPNDSFWTISKKVYGTDAYFKALVEENRASGVDENNLKPGQVISTPSVARLEKTYPDLCPKPSRRESPQDLTSTVSARNRYRTGRTYTVAEGDTLFNIARYELGKASRWAEIYDLNRDVLGKDYNYLKPGTQLSLPNNEKADVLTRQPRDVYQR